MRVSFLLFAVAALVAADQTSEGSDTKSLIESVNLGTEDGDVGSTGEGDPSTSVRTFRATGDGLFNTPVSNFGSTGDGDFNTPVRGFGSTGDDGFNTPVRGFGSTGDDGLNTPDSNFGSTGEDGFNTPVGNFGSTGDDGFSTTDDGFGFGSDDFGGGIADVTTQEGDRLVIEADNLDIGGGSSNGLLSSQGTRRPQRYQWFLSFLAPSTRGRYYTKREAERQCARRRLSLLSMENARKDRLVKRVLRKYRISAIWTSGTKRNGRWIWGSGLPIGGRYYSNWDFTGPILRPQPDNAAGGEFCLAVFYNFYSIGARWHDLRCSRDLPFICERRRF